jgi:hypothetical protein
MQTFGAKVLSEHLPFLSIDDNSPFNFYWDFWPIGKLSELKYWTWLFPRPIFTKLFRWRWEILIGRELFMKSIVSQPTSGGSNNCRCIWVFASNLSMVHWIFDK